jgi:hypothetical protein
MKLDLTLRKKVWGIVAVDVFFVIYYLANRLTCSPLANVPLVDCASLNETQLENGAFMIEPIVRAGFPDLDWDLPSLCFNTTATLDPTSATGHSRAQCTSLLAPFSQVQDAVSTRCRTVFVESRAAFIISNLTFILALSLQIAFNSWMERKVNGAHTAYHAAIAVANRPRVDDGSRWQLGWHGQHDDGGNYDGNLYQRRRRRGSPHDFARQRRDPFGDSFEGAPGTSCSSGDRDPATGDGGGVGGGDLSTLHDLSVIPGPASPEELGKIDAAEKRIRRLLLAFAACNMFFLMSIVVPTVESVEERFLAGKPPGDLPKDVEASLTAVRTVIPFALRDSEGDFLCSSLHGDWFGPAATSVLGLGNVTTGTFSAAPPCLQRFQCSYENPGVAVALFYLSLVLRLVILIHLLKGLFVLFRYRTRRRWRDAERKSGGLLASLIQHETAAAVRAAEGAVGQVQGSLISMAGAQRRRAQRTARGVADGAASAAQFARQYLRRSRRGPPQGNNIGSNDNHLINNNSHITTCDSDPPDLDPDVDPDLDLAAGLDFVPIDNPGEVELIQMEETGHRLQNPGELNI